MGNVISYSGLATKIRAMQAKLINDGQFEEIAQMGSVNQVISFLKKTRQYGERWTGIDEDSLHRGDAERMLRYSVFQDFAKIYHFANKEQRKFLALYFKRYEILFIKECMRAVFDHRDVAVDLSIYEEFFRHHSKLDIHRMVECETIDELVASMKGSEYYESLSKILGREDALIFDYGMALDLYYFGQIWKVKNKLFKGNDLNEITHAYGGKFDLLNLQWIQRSKQYYNMAPADIYVLLIPLDFKLKREEITALVEAPNMEEFERILDRTYYGRHYERLSAKTLEEFYTYHLRHVLERESGRDPYSVATLYSYMYHKEHEVDRLTTAIECVRYGVEPEETMSYIRKN